MRGGSFGFALAVGLTFFGVVRGARAQSFNAVTWTPLVRQGSLVTDAVGPTPNELDVVGDVTYAAAFVASDASDLYLRIRVNDKPTNADGTFKPSLWGCVVDTDGVLTTYEYLVVLDGQDSVHWRFNKAESVGKNSPMEPAEVLVGTAPRTTHARAVSTESAMPFSGSDDWFVDIAIPWAIIRAAGSAAPMVIAGAPMRFICGTSALTFDISSDQATTAASGALDLSWSEPYVCAGSGCAIDQGTTKPPVMDAGPDAAMPVADAGPPRDAAVPVEAGVPPPAADDGALEGTGLICAASWPPGSRQSPGGSRDAAILAAMAAMAAAIAIKLRRSR